LATYFCLTGEKIMNAPLARQPYSPPQTSMEKHIAELVAHLKDGTDNRSGFAAKIEHAMSHAFLLEAECQRLRAENRQLEKDLTVGMLPSFTACWKGIETMEPLTMETAQWDMEPLRWRIVMRQHQSQADLDGWRRIRRAAFKQLVKRIRTVFERTFPDRPLYSKQAPETIAG
jgi:hypothetical protein